MENKAIRLKISPSFVTKSVLDSFKTKSSFTLATLDVEGDGPQHHAAIMIWGDGADVAKARAERVVKTVNAHDALVDALRKLTNEHGHLFVCGRQTPPDPSRPCRPACEAARAALKLAESEGA